MSNESTRWHCPYCGHFSSIRHGDLDAGGVPLQKESALGSLYVGINSIVCPNPACTQVSLEAMLYNYTMHPGYHEELHKKIQHWKLLPESEAKPQPSYIPSAILEDYKEACLILTKSPKASATLARRCLQGMIRDFWDIRKGRLIDEIAALEEHVKPEDWEAIDAVRQFGNIGAHMEKDVNVIVPVDEGEVTMLIELIEQLLEDWYVDRHKRRERSARIVQLSKDKKRIAKGETAAE